MNNRADANKLRPLPQCLIRQLGASHTIIDPVNAVKELIDNAIDARASSITIEVSLDTLSVIQVRDNGTGIAPGDRPLLAKRHCTSKVHHIDEVRRVAGTSLGFRGEALASIAAMSAAMTVTTRIEGEQTAVRMSIGKDGEVFKNDPASGSIGTLVSVSDFLHHYPVRRQYMLKEANKSIGKMRHVLQAYALSRPTIRLSFRVLKVKSSSSDLTFAPSLRDNFEDTVARVIGRRAALQFTFTSWEGNGIVVQACLPKSEATVSDMSGKGSFFFVDARPMTSARGIFKRMQKSFKKHLCKMNPAFESIREPFICLDIRCLVAIYDVNIEPSKEDILFENEEDILASVEELFRQTYSSISSDGGLALVNNFVNRDSESPAESRRQSGSSHSPTQSTSINREDPAQRFFENMYGLDCALYLNPPIANSASNINENEESEPTEESRASMNPWTIARMNAPLRARSPDTLPMQQPTPPRSDPIANPISSSPASTSRNPGPFLRVNYASRSALLSSARQNHQRGLNAILRDEIFNHSQPARTNRARGAPMTTPTAIRRSFPEMPRASPTSDSHRGSRNRRGQDLSGDSGRQQFSRHVQVSHDGSTRSSNPIDADVPSPAPRMDSVGAHSLSEAPDRDIREMFRRRTRLESTLIPNTGQSTRDTSDLRRVANPNPDSTLTHSDFARLPHTAVSIVRVGPRLSTACVEDLEEDALVLPTGLQNRVITTRFSLTAIGQLMTSFAQLVGSSLSAPFKNVTKDESRMWSTLIAEQLEHLRPSTDEGSCDATVIDLSLIRACRRGCLAPNFQLSL